MPESTPIDINTLAKSVEDAVGKLGKFAEKSDLSTLQTDVQALNKAVTDLRGQIKVGDDNRKEDPTGGFKHVGEYYLAVMKAATDRATDERLKLLAGEKDEQSFAFPSAYRKVLNKAAGSPTSTQYEEGEYLMEGRRQPLKETPYQTDSLLSLTQNQPIDAGVAYVERPYVNDQDRSTGSIRGGFYAYWKNELGGMTATKPAFREFRVEPHEGYAFAYVSDKMLRNAPLAYGAFVSAGLAEAKDFKIGDAIINGDGVAKPLGVLNCPSKIEVAKETGQGAATITERNLTKMWKRMPDWMRGQAVWLANQDIEDALAHLARVVIKNDGTTLESADTPPLYNPSNRTILGRPVKFTEYNATLGTVGDLILWAPQHYVTGTRAGTGVEQSAHLKFDYAQTAFRLIFEIDGRSEWPGAFTPYKGSTTRSDIIVLATRS